MDSDLTLMRYDCMRRVGSFVGIFALVVLVGCGPPKKPAVEIMIRAGARFIVVEPQANYVRLCGPGTHLASGDIDVSGLRAVSSLSEDHRDPTKGEEIPWDTVAEIRFRDLIGNIGGELGGDFCGGQPHAVTATVTLKSGEVIQRQLIDTTDLGIEGVSERGFAVIPIRDIATLAVVPNQGWPWAKQYNRFPVHEDLPTIRVEPVSGPTRDFWSPETGTVQEKVVGNRSLQTPDFTRPGLPALIGGARIAIPWNSLKRVEIGGERMPRPGQVEAKLTGKAFYSDGRNEEVGISDGVLTTTAGGGDRISLREVAVIEFVAKSLQTIPAAEAAGPSH